MKNVLFKTGSNPVTLEGIADLTIEQLKTVRASYEEQRTNCTTRTAQDGYNKFLAEVSYWLGRKEQEAVEYSWKHG